PTPAGDQTDDHGNHAGRQADRPMIGCLNSIFMSLLLVDSGGLLRYDAEAEAKGFLNNPAFEMTSNPPNTSRSKVGDPKSRRAPGWMYLAAASFAVLQAVPALTIWGPADVDGLQASFEDGSMRLNAVTAGSYLANAGLLAGDRVLSIDDLPLRNTRDLEIVQANADA